MKFRYLILTLCLFARAGYADGLSDGVIGDPYGSTRSIDSGNDVAGDGECADTAGRGNLMDFFAMSISGNPSGTNDPWYFSWTVDSSHPLDDTAGSFFGSSAGTKANYIIGIEVACDGAPRLEMWENGQPWEREFAWNVDYFIAMFANGPNSMEAQLWRNDGGNSRSLIAGGIAVTSRVVGFRRQVEFVLPATDPIPEALRNNSTLCLYLISVQDIDGPGTVLDGVGLLNHNVDCESAAFDLTSLGSVFINTAVNCKEGLRPTDAGTNDRQCLSNPDRSVFSSIAGESCAPPYGIQVDGVVDSKYILLSEGAFAAPYSGGASAASDFVGESSARTYTYITSGLTNTVALTGGQHADIANVYAFGDTNFFYVLVTGPTSLGWDLEPDLFNLYVAIDMPGETSGNDTGSTLDAAPGSASAPAGRLVNFKGWDPDYAIELIWRGVTQGADMPARLYDATGPGTWSVAGSFLYQDVPDTSVANQTLLYSRTFPQYEFAVPWSFLGLSGPPSTSDVIRLGVYTTGDENISTANVSAWDIADQSPGIGQGCGGEGCHERVGDDALDDDHLSSAGSGDRTPFVGRSFGDPVFVPATDNGLNDVDTIEEYFALRLNIPACVPDVDIEKFTNGEDADTPVGPAVSTGTVVTWTYTLTNPGAVPLTNVVVFDDQLGPITNFVGGDVNGNRLLETNEVWTYTATGIALPGQYANIGTVTGKAVNADIKVDDADMSHYFGGSGGIDVEKSTNGEDADTPGGPLVAVGSNVVWSYVVINTGNEAITNVSLTDSDIGTVTNLVSGDVNNNRVLETNEVWVYQASGTAVTGQYSNDSVVAGTTVGTGTQVTDNDPSHYFGANPGIDIEKSTNGQDADHPSGPVVIAGSTVTWSYAVTNTGNTALTNVVVTDDQLGVIAGPQSGDGNGNNLLDVGEVWLYVTNGPASSGQYVNTGTVTAVSLVGQPVSDEDRSHHFGGDAGIIIEKSTNGQDADSPNGPSIPSGDSVTWTYAVTNSGNISLTNVVVTDDQLGVIAGPDSGDGNANNLLDVGEVWIYVTNGIAVPGQYVNTGVVSAVSLVGQPVSDDDPSHYFGGSGGIDIEKATNGEDADAPAGPIIPTGSNVVWTFVVSNTGNEPVTNVTVYDSDLGPITNLISGDLNSNALLETNEVWTYSAQGVAGVGPYQNIGTVSGLTVNTGSPVEDSDPSHYFGSAPGYSLAKSMAQPIDGPVYPGDMIEFEILIQNTGNVVLVTVPVTDRYETNHLTYIDATPASDDNLDDGVIDWSGIGPVSPGMSTSIFARFTAKDPTDGQRFNEVSTIVTLPDDHPDLPPLTNDAPYEIEAFADIGNFVWNDLDYDGIQDIGETGVVGVTVTLYDATTNAIGVTTTDVNGAYAFTGLVAGTYSVGFEIPAGTVFSPQDQLGNNTLDSDPNPVTGLTDPVTVIAGESNDTLDAGLVFPASLGDFVWLDLNNDGIQSGGEPGVENVEVSLLNSVSNVIGVTTTDVNGAYAFTNLLPGVYAVQFTKPTGTVFSAANQLGNDEVDSDADAATGITPLVTLVSGEVNDTLDAGLFAPAAAGDFVWNDLVAPDGIQEPGEPGVEGILLTLYTTNDVVVGVVTSAIDGSYAFTNLLPGSYYIKATFQLDLNLVLQFQGTNTSLDSNFSPFTGESDVFTLAPGEYNRTIDAGIREILIHANTVRVEGQNRRNSSVLVWETDSEYGTIGWMIERMDEEGSWHSMSPMLPASGNISLGGIYEWVDEGATPGQTRTYRLIEFDAYGGMTYSAPHEVYFPETAGLGEPPLVGFGLIEKQSPVVKKSAKKPVRQTESAPLGGVITGVKVSITNEGLYKVTDGQIAAALGVDIGEVNEAPLHVEYLGLPVKSMRVADGVIFYGKDYETRYTDKNVYKISLGNGEAPPNEAVTVSGGPLQDSFETMVRLEKQRIFRADLFLTPDSDPWLWDSVLRITNAITVIKNNSVSYFDLPHVISADGADFAIQVKGGSQVTTGDKLHGVKVSINGTVIHQSKFPGTTLHYAESVIPPGVLMTSSNQLLIEADSSPGVLFDTFYTDYATITYNRGFAASGEASVFAPLPGPVEVGGFSTNHIEVWDVQDVWNPVRLTGFSVIQTGGFWSAAFDVPRTGRYIAAAAAYLTNVSVEAWYEGDLKSTEHRIDYLVVHGEGLGAGAQALASMRELSGLRTKVVDAELVYNAFNHGIVDGRVLKTFLAYAYYQWEEGPRYFVLVGDGSMDYRNYAGGNDCLLPTEPEGSSYGIFSSDHSLADINNDRYIEVAVGRIPAEVPQDMVNYLAKLQAYNTGGAWRQNAFITTDNFDEGGNYFAEGNYLETKMTPKTVTRADLETLGETATVAAIKFDMEAGNELMLYVGHGNMFQMAQEPLMSIASSATITNRSRPCIIGALSCLIGSFTTPNSPSLGKVLMNDHDGAVAVFGSASLITLAECREISAEILDALYQDETDRFGDAWITAKNAMAATNLFRVTRNYQLLGDPAVATGDDNAPREGLGLSAAVAPYDVWKTWAFPPAWLDLGIGTEAGDNPDGDELTNEEEQRAGTDPLDADSEIVVVNVLRASGDDVEIIWPSIAGRTYRVERAYSAYGSYTTIVDNVNATPPFNAHIDTSATAGSSVYRVYLK